MPSPPFSTNIIDLSTNKQIDAVIDLITQDDKDFYTNVWEPALLKAKADKRNFIRYNLNWSENWYEFKDNHSVKTYVLKDSLNNEPQGMMMVSVDGISFPDLIYPKDNNLIYARLLEKAPWNHNFIGITPEFSRIGTAFFHDCMMQLPEYNGRFGLHSTEGAELFYENVIGMTCKGRDCLGAGKY